MTPVGANYCTRFVMKNLFYVAYYSCECQDFFCAYCLAKWLCRSTYCENPWVKHMRRIHIEVDEIYIFDTLNIEHFLRGSSSHLLRTIS